MGLNREPRTKPNSPSTPRRPLSCRPVALTHQDGDDPARPFRNGRSRSVRAGSPDRRIPSPSTAPVVAPLPPPAPSLPVPPLRRRAVGASHDCRRRRRRAPLAARRSSLLPRAPRGRWGRRRAPLLLPQVRDAARPRAERAGAATVFYFNKARFPIISNLLTYAWSIKYR